MRRQLALASLLLVATSANRSRAEEGFALDRFNPAERGSEWHAADSLDIYGRGRPALGVVFDYAHKPLGIYDADGDEVAALVEEQLFVHVGGAVVLADRLRLGANLPLLAHVGGEKHDAGGETISADEGEALGDPRLGADVRLLGARGGALNAAAGLQLFVPIGKQDAYASDGKLRVRPRMLVAGDVRLLAYAAEIGFSYRAARDEEDAIVGNEVDFVLGVGVRLGEAGLIGAELFGATVVDDRGDGAFGEGTTALELLLGGKYRVGDFRCGLGVGPGLTHGAGTPAFRAVWSIEWAPAPSEAAPPPIDSDRDRDGVADGDDACPDRPGSSQSDPKISGCPSAAGDADGDAIGDDVDACPREAGVASPDASKHGCVAVKDTDQDGIADPLDACPTVPGAPSDDPKRRGCSVPKDRDADGINDDKDACPEDAGVTSSDASQNGCPQVNVDQIEIMDLLVFGANQYKILPEHEPILVGVVRLLQSTPAITKVRVEGHSDRREGKDVGHARALAVVKWMIGQGIDPSRLEAKGFGATKPIAASVTEAARRQNQRVEFRVIGRAKKAAK